MNTTYYYEHIVPLLRFQNLEHVNPPGWTKMEENRVLGLYKAGKTPTEIAKAFPTRTVAGIKMKLARMLRE